MTSNKLQLNDTKTEAMIALSNRMSTHTTLPSVIHVGDADVPFVFSVKNPGATMDSNLSISQHINNTWKTAYIQISHISSIRHLPTIQTTETLACCLVLSRLDYCNSLLPGCPQYLSDLIQISTQPKKNTFCIWHPYLRHPSCQHKTIRRKIIPLYRPICLEQSASVSPSLWFFFFSQNRS